VHRVGMYPSGRSGIRPGPATRANNQTENDSTREGRAVGATQNVGFTGTNTAVIGHAEY